MTRKLTLGLLMKYYGKGKDFKGIKDDCLADCKNFLNLNKDSLLLVESYLISAYKCGKDDGCKDKLIDKDIDY